jgi:hypothetical protein
MLTGDRVPPVGRRGTGGDGSTDRSSSRIRHLIVLDGIEVDEESDDYEIADIAEDDSLVGYQCPQPHSGPVLRRDVPCWYPRDAVLLMRGNGNTSEETSTSAGGTARFGGSVFERRCSRNSSTRARPVHGSPWNWKPTTSPGTLATAPDFSIAQMFKGCVSPAIQQKPHEASR